MDANEIRRNINIISEAYQRWQDDDEEDRGPRGGFRRPAGLIKKRPLGGFTPPIDPGFDEPNREDIMAMARWLATASDPANGPEDQVMADQTVERVKAALAAMPELDRRVIEIYMDDPYLDMARMADRLGTKQHLVRKAFFRAIARLRNSQELRALLETPAPPRRVDLVTRMLHRALPRDFGPIDLGSRLMEIRPPDDHDHLLTLKYDASGHDWNGMPLASIRIIMQADRFVIKPITAAADGWPEDGYMDGETLHDLARQVIGVDLGIKGIYLQDQDFDDNPWYTFDTTPGGLMDRLAQVLDDPDVRSRLKRLLR